jgi:predicted SprT family Zn-dependent metalloprotease
MVRKEATSTAVVRDSNDEHLKYRRIERIFHDVNRRYFGEKIKKPEFRLNRRMRKAGSVDLRTWRVDISVSYHDKYGWDEELRNTLEHEMIHLYLKIAGKPTGHNRHFKEIMERIGCTLHSKPNKGSYRYIFVCPRCGKEYKARKWIGERYSCGVCSQDIFDRQYVLQFKSRLC